MVERMVPDAKSGAYRTPFYHVFETRKAARAFRAEYQKADGEQMRPRPKLADDELRKSRTGKGGKPSHKPQEQAAPPAVEPTPDTIGTPVPTGTQVPQAIGTQVPTIHEQVYPRTEESDSAPQADAVSPPNVVQFPTPPPKPKKQREPDPLFDAVKEHVFGIEGEAAGGRIGIISSWLAGKNEGKRGEKVGLISKPAEPQHVKMFAEWCERKGYSAPHDLVKFVENWRKWATEMNGSLKSKSPLSGLKIITNDDGEAMSA